MHILEAKDFLVQQTTEQAALENVPLSDLEKRMMYFTETDECPEDPIALNDAFEAEYDTHEYEDKISKLMHHAYQRIKQESPEKLRLWKEAFGVLSEGDHYILLFWGKNAIGKSPQVRSSYGLSLLFAITLTLFIFIFLGTRSSARRGGHAPIDKYLPPPGPLVEHILQLLFVLAVLFVMFPHLYSKLSGIFSRQGRRLRQK